MTGGLLCIIIGIIGLLMGIVCFIWHDKLNNHTPFSEVEFSEYLLSAIGAILVTPGGVFGVIVGILLLFNS